MFETVKKCRNVISATDLAIKGMRKRRKLAYSAILNICDKRSEIRVVK